MTQNQTPEELDPAAAFEAMGRRLAGLTAAVDGLAVTFQEVHARDYSPELAKIDARFEAVRDFVDKLKEKPAMALTPEQIAAEIEAAGRNGRHADHTAWRQAQNELHIAANSIGRVVGAALEEETRYMLTPLRNGGTRLTLQAQTVLRIDPTAYWEPIARIAFHLNVQRVLKSAKLDAERLRID